MGRSLLIEDSIQDTVSSHLSSQKFQVGLVIGQLTENKDYAIHFVKCPEPVTNAVEVEEESPDSDKNSNKSVKEKRKEKSSQNNDIDSNWIIEHARQVNRMLTGGLSVIGVYIFCAPDNLAKDQAKISACLQSIYRRIERNKFLRCCLPHVHRYLVHICLYSKKLTCKTIDMQEDLGHLHPAESRFQSFLSNWSSINTSVDINVQFHVPILQGSNRIENHILSACQHEFEDIMNSFVVVGSKLVDNNKLINEGLKTKKTKNENNDIKITLFKQINSGGKKEFLKYNKSNVHIKFVGSIVSKAFINAKGCYGDAVKALKYDIIRSILTRIELLCEEAQVNNIPQVDEWSLMSPTRVFAPFMKDQIYFCDYVFKDETADDTLGRYSELLDIIVKKSELLYPEKSPEISEVSMILHGANHADHQSDLTSEISSLSTPDEPKDKKIFAALLAGFAALTAGVIHFIWRE